MSDDWKPGDQALCLNTEGWINAFSLRASKGPQSGYVGTVTSITRAEIGTVSYIGLGFPEFEGEFESSFFRKITPGTEIKGAEIERQRFKQGNPWKEPA